MLKFHDNQFSFYGCKVTFYDGSELKTEYTDNPSLYSQMVSNYKNLSNLNIESLVPTEEQQQRLNTVNGLIGSVEHPEWGTQQADTFVETGYVDYDAPEWMQSLIKNYESVSKSVLLAKLSKRLSTMKTEKEYGGVTYGSHVLATDLESQSKISSVMLGFTAGMITETQFKFKTGFETMNAEQFGKVATFLMAHVQSAFAAESLAKESLAKLSFKKLLDYDIDKKTTVGTEEVEDKLQTLFNTNYTSTLEAYTAVASVK